MSTFCLLARINGSFSRNWLARIRQRLPRTGAGGATAEISTWGRLQNTTYQKYICKPQINSLAVFARYKYTKKSAKGIDEDEDLDLEDEDQDEFIADKSSKIVTGHMASLRADSVIKSGLGLARNKVETMFYESRIRVNGNKIPKKSLRVEVGDEVDVIKGRSPMNEEFLNVSRVVVLSCRENDTGDGLVVKMRRFKTLTIEDYPHHPWKSAEQ